jgi:hypothetical protein
LFIGQYNISVDYQTRFQAAKPLFPSDLPAEQDQNDDRIKVILILKLQLLRKLKGIVVETQSISVFITEVHLSGRCFKTFGSVGGSNKSELGRIIAEIDGIAYVYLGISHQSLEP